jgi:non-specific serine/threonine protein kinase
VADPPPADRTHVHPLSPVRFPRRERSWPSLPVPLTSFVGREQEAAAVVALLREPDVRLVTLTGPGGVGKTRLAVRVADEVAGAPSTSSGQAFANGVAFVPLAAVPDAALVVPAVAHALGVREAGDRPLADRLVDALRERHLLLVLDNVEHVAAAAPFVVALLVGCPGLTVLATGRASLRLSGEHVVAIPPLGVPSAGGPASAAEIGRAEAVRLFVARARAARHDFVLTDGNAADVAAVVRRLDGLPLAVELAAARVAHLPPAALLTRLGRLLPMLTGGAQDLPPRQRTMAATIAWSHDLLSPEERILFRRLAVFVGGFTLEAAEAVAATFGRSGADVLDGIASLMAMSLLRQVDGPDTQTPRYAMLEMIREFGWDRLTTSGEECEARRAHAGFFLALAERADPSIWGGPDHRLWLDRLEADLPNLRAALAWLEASGSGSEFLRLAAALGGLWQFRSYRVEAYGWLTRALAKGGDTVPAARAMALLKLGVLEMDRGGREAAGLVAESVAIRQHLGDERGVGHALIMLGRVLMDQGDVARAVQVTGEAAALLERLGDLTGLALTRLQLGRAALLQGDTERAQTLLTEALTRYRQAGFTYGVANTLLTLGQFEADRGNPAAAACHFAESVRLWDEIKNLEGLTETLAATGRMAVTVGRPDATPWLLGAAAALGEALGTSPSPLKHAQREHAAVAARPALGEEKFAASWAAGRALSPEEAAAETSALLTALSESIGTQERVDGEAQVGLTPREREVLDLVADGLSDREVAAVLSVGPGTVRSHLTSAFGKLGVGSRTAAVAAARRRGIL